MGAAVDWETFQAAHETLLGYCRFVDEGRVEDFVALYTEDCLQEEGMKPSSGREAMRARVSSVIGRYAATSHHLSNVSMARNADGTVAAVSYIYAWHRPRAGGEDLEVWGRYLDVLRFEGGRWLIAHRKLEVAGVRGMDNPGFATVPRQAAPAG